MLSNKENVSYSKVTIEALTFALRELDGTLWKFTNHSKFIERNFCEFLWIIVDPFNGW